MSGVAIIGAGGFVGSRLIESLVLDGCTNVRAVVRSYRNIAAFCQYGDAVDTRLANAEDPVSLAAALEGAVVAVNLTTGPPSGIVRSTRAILEACARAGVRRLVHLSSAVVYGDVTEPIGDDDPPVARHWMPYARAKAESERWLLGQIERQHDVEIIVLRPGIVWGVRSPHTLAFAQSLAAKNAFLSGDASGIFNGIYIDNLTSAIRACCDCRRRVVGFFNVGDRETITWRDFFGAIGPALDCDTRQLPTVSAEQFPWSVGAAVDAIQSMGPVNALYHRLKSHVPDGVKSAVKSRLEGAYMYDRHAGAYAARPSVSREQWHLQRVRHKLPTGKFERAFHHAPPVSFQEGVRRTLTWLAALGLVSPAFPQLND